MPAYATVAPQTDLRLNIFVTHGLCDALDSAAMRRGFSRSEMVRHALTSAYDHDVPAGEDEEGGNQVCVRVPGPLVDRIDDEAKAAGIPRGRMAKRRLAGWLAWDRAR